MTAARPTTRTKGDDTWMTPKAIFDPVHRAFDFDLDGAAGSAREARLPVFIDPETDALSTSWRFTGSRVWLNPPYGRTLKHWIEKASGECGRGVDLVVTLIYANVDTNYWRDFVSTCEHTAAVIFIHGRVHFVSVDEGQVNASPKGSALIVYSKTKRDGPAPHLYWDYKNQPLDDVLAQLPDHVRADILPAHNL